MRFSLIGLGCCLVMVAGCRLPGHPCPANHSAGRSDRCNSGPPAPSTAPLAIQAERSNLERPGIVPPLGELPPDLKACPVPTTVPPQRVIIEVLQQAAATPKPEHPSAASLAPAPFAPLPAAITPPPAAPPFATMPAIAGPIVGAVPPTIGLAIDLGAILDWFRSPFGWLRFVAMPPTPIVPVSGTALVPVQAPPAVLPAAAMIAAPTVNQAALRPAEVDELTRQIGELRKTINTLQRPAP